MARVLGVDLPRNKEMRKSVIQTSPPQKAPCLLGRQVAKFDENANKKEEKKRKLDTLNLLRFSDSSDEGCV